MADRVVLVTGASRGQGRAHAVRLAQEGADIIAVDLGHDLDTVAYPLGTADDLDETAALVRREGQHIVTAIADVRDRAVLTEAVAKGVAQFGHLDGVVANAGIVSYGRSDAIDDRSWQDVLDVNLTGVWNTTSVAVPHLRAHGRGGSVVLISSGAGLAGLPNGAHYAAAKHGLVGLMRTLAMELGGENIRVNSVHPAQVDTPMIRNSRMYELFMPDPSRRSEKRFEEISRRMNLLPVPWVEPIDVANAVLFLLSDEARYITGVTLPVDAGALTK